MKNARIDYGYVHFSFRWTWIRDKEMVVRGDKWSGMLMIYNDKGKLIKIYGYELVKDIDDEEE